MSPLFIESASLIAPGMNGWAEALPVLRGEQTYVRQELPVFQPTLLPPNERRRATQAVRLAFRAAEDAISTSSIAAENLASVFASSDADTNIVHRIGSALAEDSRVVSPTDFHNSVHNAAPGYWGIAARAKLPSNSISACEASFAAGLLEAAASAQQDGYDQLLVAYDIRPPELILPKRQMPESCGVALVLTRARGPAAQAELRISLSLSCTGTESSLSDAALEALRRANPAARALPLLRLLALKQAGAVTLRATGQLWLRLELSPCF